MATYNYQVSVIDAAGNGYNVPCLNNQPKEQTEAQARELYASALAYLREEPSLHEFDYNRLDGTTLEGEIGYEPTDDECSRHTVSVVITAISTDAPDDVEFIESHDFFCADY